MLKVNTYIILSNSSINGLITDVTNAMSNGWQPIGGVQFGSLVYMQAMVKYNKEA